MREPQSEDTPVETFVKSEEIRIKSEETFVKSPNGYLAFQVNNEHLKNKLRTEISEKRKLLANKLEEIKNLQNSVFPKENFKEIIDTHIKKLHAYNEIRDAAQILIGRCAERETRTVNDIYKQFSLDPSE